MTMLSIFIGCLLLVLGFKFLYYTWKIALCMILFALIIFVCAAWGHEYTPSDVVQIGKVVYHEAGNQSELGQRLVADTILNRVESDEFPNSVNGVITQPGQYCNPKKYPPEDIYHIVAEEIYTRTNDRVLWYRTKKYHPYGIPLLVEGDHYFSGR